MRCSDSARFRSGNSAGALLLLGQRGFEALSIAGDHDTVALEIGGRSRLFDWYHF